VTQLERQTFVRLALVLEGWLLRLAAENMLEETGGKRFPSMPTESQVLSPRAPLCRMQEHGSRRGLPIAYE